MERIKRLPKLYSQNVANSKVTNSGLTHLADMETLEWLYLGRTEVTDTGLAAVGELKNLRGLDLLKTRITDSGLRQIEGTHSPGILDIVRNSNNQRRNYLPVWVDSVGKARAV